MRDKPLHTRLIWKAKRCVRWVMTRLTRPTYRRSLHYLTGRDEMPRLLNERGLVGSGVEIGVKEGWFSELILERWDGAILHSVDPWDAEIDPNGDHGELGQPAVDRLFEKTQKRLARFGDRSAIVRKTSSEAARDFEAGSLDFVYIDAGHDLESVRADIAAWYPLVRPGGILAGHDYMDGPVQGSMFGVKTAVDEFAADEGLEVAETLRDAPFKTWFIEIREGLG